MNQDDKWRLIHAYRAAAEEGLVPEILCPNDEAECVPLLGPEGDPVLRCIECNTVFHIGLHVFDQMVQNLKELNVQA